MGKLQKCPRAAGVWLYTYRPMYLALGIYLAKVPISMYIQLVRPCYYVVVLCTSSGHVLYNKY